MEEDLGDAQAVFGLTRKDLARSSSALQLSDLSARQQAFALCAMNSSLCPADLMEIGGELAVCLHLLWMGSLRISILV